MPLPRNFYTARLRAVDNQTGYPFLWMALNSLVLVVTDSVPTLATDCYWRCYVNPNFFDRLTEDQGAMVLIHELWHPLGLDWERAKAAVVRPEEHYIWNIVRDCELNAKDDLLSRLPSLDWEEGGHKLSCRPCRAEDFDLPKGLFAEQMFALLREKRPDLLQPRVGILCLPGAGDCGSCADGQARSWDLPSPEHCDTPGQSAARTKLIQAATARSILEAVQGRGNVPAGWQRWAKEVLEPRVKWREELPPTVRGLLAATSGGPLPDWHRFGRRQTDPRILNPGRRRAVQKVAVIVDTSGSMSDRFVCQGVAEVDGILKALGNAVAVSVYFTDAAAAPAQRVTSASRLIPYGGGGTDMGEGFKAVEEAARKDPAEAPDLIVCVTDGMTPWPEEPPRKAKTVVLILGPHGEGPKWAVAPYGKTIRVADV